MNPKNYINEKQLNSSFANGEKERKRERHRERGWRDDIYNCNEPFKIQQKIPASHFQQSRSLIQNYTQIISTKSKSDAKLDIDYFDIIEVLRKLFPQREITTYTIL